MTEAATNAWLQVRCPEEVRIWRVALKARNITGRNITAWTFMGSNSGKIFTTLISSTTTLEGSAQMPSFFDINTAEKYMFYRLQISASTGSNDVGIHHMQLYVYDA